jgi:glycosyltransferase involved in cell wall biosynthesis
VNELPLVSILIASYNQENYVGRAIESCLNQTYSPIEIIVVDDGSTDRSGEIITDFGDKIIPIFKENEGAVSTRNVGFKICKGDYICFLDSDDYYFPEKVTEMVKVVTADSEIGWYFHRIKAIDSMTGELIRVTPGKTTGYCDLRKDIRKGRLPIHAPTSGLSFSRKLLEKMLPLPAIKKYGISDLYLRAVAASLMPGFFEDRPLAVLWVHRDNKFSSFSVEKLLPRMASLLIKNAYWLRKKWPDIYRYSNRILGHGIGVSRRISGIEKEYEDMASEYLKLSSYQDRFEIFFYSMYYQYFWNPQKRVQT